MVSVIVHNSKNRVRIPLKSTVFSVKLFNGPGWLIKQKITFLKSRNRKWKRSQAQCTSFTANSHFVKRCWHEMNVINKTCATHLRVVTKKFLQLRIEKRAPFVVFQGGFKVPAPVLNFFWRVEIEYYSLFSIFDRAKYLSLWMTARLFWGRNIVWYCRWKCGSLRFGGTGSPKIWPFEKSRRQICPDLIVVVISGKIGVSPIGFRDGQPCGETTIGISSIPAVPGAENRQLRLFLLGDGLHQNLLLLLILFCHFYQRLWTA